MTFQASLGSRKYIKGPFDEWINVDKICCIKIMDTRGDFVEEAQIIAIMDNDQSFVLRKVTRYDQAELVLQEILDEIYGIS